MSETITAVIITIMALACALLLGAIVDARRKRREIERMPKPKAKKPKFKEKGEVVGTNIVHMSERLKIENIDREAQPYWPLRKEDK